MDPAGILFWLYVALLVIGACTDVLWLKIPNSLAVLLVLLFVVTVLWRQPEISVIAHVFPALGLFLVGVVLFYFGKVGGGDVKFMGAVALFVGFDLLPNFLVSLAIAGAAVALTFLLAGRMLAWSLGRHDGAQGRKIRLPESLAQPGQVPYGLAISLASLAVVRHSAVFM